MTGATIDSDRNVISMVPSPSTVVPDPGVCSEDSEKQLPGVSPDDVDEGFSGNGTQSWLILLGATCNSFATFGYASSWGVFQAYYQGTMLRDSSPSAIAWIGSAQYALILLPGLAVGRLFDLGYFHCVFLPCSIMIVVATALIGECTKYWQFLICQGFVVGLACGGIYHPRNAILAHWFGKSSRGRALGFSVTGASVAGITIPIVIKALIPRVGFPWTMRVIALVLLLVLGVCNLTLKRKFPAVNIRGGLFNLGAFRETRFTIYCVSAFFVFLGLYTVLTYVDVSAMQLGTSSNMAFYFVSFSNGGAFVGRFIGGIIADIFGPLNTMVPFSLACALLTCAWPFMKSTPLLITTTVLYGVCTGVFSALFPVPAMNLGGPDDVGRRIGMFVTVSALGAFGGPPISGLINQKAGGFQAVGFYAGGTMSLGVSCMLVVRYLSLRKWRGKI